MASSYKNLSRPSLKFPDNTNGTEIWSITAPPVDIGHALLALREGNGEQRACAVRSIGDAAFLKGAKIPEAVEPLCELLMFDDETKVREEAAWALWKLQDHKAADSLFYALSKDTVLDVREKAARALGLLGVRRAAPLMIALLSMGKQVSSKLRAALVAALGLLADERAAKVILQSAHDAEPTVRYEAVKSLGRCLVAFPRDVREKAFNQIKKSLSPRRERIAAIRQASIKALRMCNDRRAAEVVAKAAINDPDAQTRRQALEALRCFEGPQVETALIDCLEDSNWEVRKTAGLVLAELALRSKVHNPPRVCEALARMERMFPSGSREWRLAAMAFANL